MSENRLIYEKSPYLLQHAHNPVDWYPWGSDAFEKAKNENKPVFLSIGYSTCHWCHVMERESFESEEVADLLNRSFVAIKVDREERPDIDSVYMSVCQTLTGGGGWPLTILMTPKQEPFWAGTYIPEKSRYGQPGMLELLSKVESVWKQEREKLISAGEEIASYIAEDRNGKSAEPDRELMHLGLENFIQEFDRKNGGFGVAPKFPTPHNLIFLMNYARLESDKKAQEMAETTLTQMARGGIFDQIGGGFSRYSTDTKWLAPHFEKMLYDNAMLIYAYLEAFSETGNSFYKKVAERTLEYVFRELTGPEGEFYCGQDADSDGVEGKYYLFTPMEIGTLLGEENGELFCKWYGISKTGNFNGKSIPNLLNNSDYLHEPEKLTVLRDKVYKYRLLRNKLHLDDKVLTSWNALMITALAKAYKALGDICYLEAAIKDTEFIRNHLKTEDGRLKIRWRDAVAAYSGQLDDYAFYAMALLELYEACFDVSYLKEAVDIAAEMEKHFWDSENRGFYLTADDAEKLISRPKDIFDGAMPSGNSVAGLVLQWLWKLTGEEKWGEYAEKQISFLAGAAKESPMGHSFAMISLCEAVYPTRELVCALSGDIPSGLRELVYKHKLHTLVKTSDNQEILGKVAPFTTDYPIPKNGDGFYLCEGDKCVNPVYSIEDLYKIL